MLVCLHEEHAISIAHGYAKVTERPMAAAVHANVGLMHASMAIYNAFCDRVPMLIRVILDRWMRQNGDHGSIGFTQLEIKEL
jgi:thiamine pyrophosphate-dependent acetolactate synthase large subunit-like protein